MPRWFHVLPSSFVNVLTMSQEPNSPFISLRRGAHSTSQINTFFFFISGHIVGRAPQISLAHQSTPIMSFDPDQTMYRGGRRRSLFPVTSTKANARLRNVESDTDLTLKTWRAIHASRSRDHLGRSCWVIFVSCFLPWASPPERL